MSLRDATMRIRGGENLEFEEMKSAMHAIMSGHCTELEIGEFLLALRGKGETITEIAAAAAALREHMIPIVTKRKGVVDTCGTGGDGQRTFNISTAAALVAAAVGAAVAKHGNRKVTSSSGSADVLSVLGIRIDAPVETVTRCLDELGICFCYAQQLHPAMRNVAAVRQSLGVPTIFNYLGPLSNPARAPYQLVGTARKDVHEKLAGALRLLGTTHAAVVTGNDGLDEVTISTITEVTLVTGEGLKERFWSPEDFGVPRGLLDSIRADSPRQSAALIERVLDGERGPARDVVVMNASAALFVAGIAPDLPAGVAMAGEAIDTGRARRLLADLIKLTHQGAQSAA